MRSRIYDVAGPTTGFGFIVEKPVETSFTATRIVYRGEISEGPFEGRNARIETYGDFDPESETGRISEERQSIGGDLHFSFEYDERIRLQNFDEDFAAALLTGVVGVGNRFANQLENPGGDDVFYGRDGDDELGGGGGRDRLYGQSGRDRLEGDAGADRLYGGGGRDRVGGTGGRDVLYGGDDEDVLYGGSGRDRLEGGLGADLMTGGGGADVFRFRAAKFAGNGEDRDRIDNFRAGSDRIDLRSIDANEDLAGDQTFRFIGDDAFSDRPRELRYANGVVFADTDGDGRSDFHLGFEDGPELTVEDFLL